MFVNPVLRIIDTIYRKLIRIGDHLQSVFLLILRLIWGHLFFIAGYTKLQDIDAVIRFFTGLGISHASYHAYSTAFIEVIGGFCLFFGLASRLAALVCSFLMIAAISTAHHHVFNWDLFYQPATLFQQLPFTFLLASLTIFVFGPGKVSLDGWIKRLSAQWEKY